MTLRSKTRNLRHLNHMQHVLIANEQIIFQKNVGVFPMPLITQTFQAGSSSRQLK